MQIPQEGEVLMPVRVAINGFGRVGRRVLRDDHGLEPAAEVPHDTVKCSFVQRVAVPVALAT